MVGVDYEMLRLATRQTQNQMFSLSIVLFLVVLLCMTNFPQSLVSAQGASDLSGVHVAVYIGGHSTENLASRIAIINMLEWMNVEITLLSPEAMLNDSLAGHALLVMPGISPYTLRDEMTSTGYDIIRNFIRNGGAYIGIYGGAYFEWAHFELFEVELQNMLPDLPATKSLVTITINKNGTGPNLSDLPDSFSTLSWMGSYFDAPDMSHVTTIANYAQNGLPCMVTFKFGLGNVFLSSPHPEIEEGDARDGTEFQDGLNDPDSEWGLMQVIACWLINVSGVAPLNPILVLTVASVIAAIVIFAGAIVIIYRRQHIK